MIHLTIHSVYFSDKASICKKEKVMLDNVAHPYDCSKFIKCSSGNTTEYVNVLDVWQPKGGGGNIYNPTTGQSDRPENVACAKQKGTFK